MEHGSATLPIGLAIGFPLLFAGMWICIAYVLSHAARWPEIEGAYPDREQESPLLRLRGQSGSMGVGVGMNGVLTISACPSGLRIAINRLFGPFSRPFLVPWDEIRADARRSMLGDRTRLGFGIPERGSLRIGTATWERLLVAAGRSPAPGPMEIADTRRRSRRTLLIQWAAITFLAGCFYSLAPILTTGRTVVPIPVAFIFPGVVFGVAQLVRVWREAR